MAVWQYGFLVIPKEGLSNDLFNQQLGEEYFDDSPFWKGLDYTIDAFRGIEKVLPKRKSWSNNVVLFGHEESSCIEVLLEAGFVVSVSFRIDFSSSYQALLDEVNEFFILKGFLLIDESRMVVPLNIIKIKRVIETSSQYQKYREILEQMPPSGSSM